MGKRGEGEKGKRKEKRGEKGGPGARTVFPVSAQSPTRFLLVVVDRQNYGIAGRARWFYNSNGGGYIWRPSSRLAWRHDTRNVDQFYLPLQTPLCGLFPHCLQGAPGALYTACARSPACSRFLVSAQWTRARQRVHSPPTHASNLLLFFFFSIVFSLLSKNTSR